MFQDGKQFLDVVPSFLADNVTTLVAWISCLTCPGEQNFVSQDRVFVGLPALSESGSDPKG